ncbi:hypothetical protein FACS1894103_0810 [Campylobacterota bacterium]|nr:hypothetical protein FACS1894103_0810 [Campylobacterota bacterium]
MNAKVLLLFFLIFAQTTVFAQNLADVQKRGVLRIGFENNYAPFEMDGKDGNVGFDVEIARGFAREIGVKTEFFDIEWDNLLPSLDNGSVDMVISAMTITTERREKADFSSPYFVSGQAILLNRSKASAIKSFRDLNTPSVHIVEKQGTFADGFVKTFFF